MSSTTSFADIDRHPATDEVSRRPVRVLRWSLRLFGSVDLLAIIAVFMPVVWMREIHAQCGLGAFPQGPLPIYLARSTSMLYAFHGVILWSLSMDVRRYHPVVRCLAMGTIICGLLLIPIDLAAGIPAWWTWLEGPSFAFAGLWLLAWSNRAKPAAGE